MAPTSTPASNPSLTPALPPPPGVIPNFTDPVSQASSVLAANGIIMAVMLLFVLARFFAKFAYARSQLGWEDLSCAVGTTLSVAQMGLIVWLFRSGLGPHIWDISLARYQNEAGKISRVLTVTSAVHNVTLIFTKLSILLLFFRLFSVSRRARIWIYGGIVMTLALHITGAALSLTTATPIPEAPPSPEAPGGPRVTSQKSSIATGISAVNVANDIYILILPLVEVSRMQLYKRQRIRILTIFSTGLLACVAGVVALVLRFVNWPYPDITWNVGPWCICSLYEIDIGLIVGCMPILPLIAKHSEGLERLVFKFQSSLSYACRRRHRGSIQPKNEAYSSDINLHEYTEV